MVGDVRIEAKPAENQITCGTTARMARDDRRKFISLAQADCDISQNQVQSE